MEQLRDTNIRNSEVLAFFKKLSLAFIRPSANSAFYYHNSKSAGTGRKLNVQKTFKRLFPVNIAKFLRTSILKNICEQLLLKATSKTWTWILDLDSGPWTLKTWTLKSLDLEKHGKPLDMEK